MIAKKTYIWVCAILLALVATTAQAQPGEKFKATRIAYITNALDLSPSEAQSFWPVYNAYKEELEDIQRQKNKIQRGVRIALETKTENELSDLSDEYISLSVTQAEVQARYHQEFKKVLPVKKVVLLYKVEQELNRKILDELRRRQEERKRNRR